MERLGGEFMPPLNEGTILEMPVTVPRASVTQVSDDLIARDALLRSFPEVESVVGKAGRAETPTDPAPLDMIETIINLRPREHWAKRELRYEDAAAQTRSVLGRLVSKGWIKADAEQQTNLVNDATMFAIEDFDRSLRASARTETHAFESKLAPQLTKAAVRKTVELLRQSNKLKRQPTNEEVRGIARKLAPQHGVAIASSPDISALTDLASETAEQLAEKGIVIADANLLAYSPGPLEQVWRDAVETLGGERVTFFSKLLEAVEEERGHAWVRFIDDLNWRLFDQAVPLYTHAAARHLHEQAVEQKLWIGPKFRQDSKTASQLEAAVHPSEPQFAKNLLLWRRTDESLLKEIDTTVQVPGWGNIWTQPIINRIDMLATGVRTMIGVKVYGNDLNEIQTVTNDVAAALKTIRGAADVFPDQIIGEGYIEIDIDRERAARYGVSVGDIQDVIETALGGRVVTTTVEGRERFPVRIRYARDFRADEESVKNLLVSASPGMNRSMSDRERPEGIPVQGEASLPEPSAPAQIPLSQVADVQVVEGPSMIKSENGLLRAYVQLNVRDRDMISFIEEAQLTVAQQVKLPAGTYLEWSGQFEHQLRAKRTLTIIVPVVIAAILLLLYITYHDLADMLCVIGLGVPGAVAGGMLFQYLWGFNFSVAVWVGYIACFGLATENGLVMLVYLREAIEKRGGLANMPFAEIKAAVMEGAVHRTRPKLLTEVTTILGLAPMLWATGTGAELMRPMAAPVLGGMLVSDEVIDLLLPVLFYGIRKRRWQKLRGDVPDAGRKALESPEADEPQPNEELALA
jgi:Cu(I)/Ag(I) efflux system membrane protein CusA/SilA